MRAEEEEEENEAASSCWLAPRGGVKKTLETSLFSSAHGVSPLRVWHMKERRRKGGKKINEGEAYRKSVSIVACVRQK